MVQLSVEQKELIAKAEAELSQDGLTELLKGGITLLEESWRSAPHQLVRRGFHDPHVSLLARALDLGLELLFPDPQPDNLAVVCLGGVEGCLGVSE